MSYYNYLTTLWPTNPYKYEEATSIVIASNYGQFDITNPRQRRPIDRPMPRDRNYHEWQSNFAAPVVRPLLINQREYDAIAAAGLIKQVYPVDVHWQPPGIAHVSNVD